MKRVDSIDIVRGLVMIIMVLDHTRDLIHVSSLTQQPTDLATATPAVFLTRWITHICAPTFLFLSGASAYLGSRKPAEAASHRKRLITRGLLLVLLDLTFVNFGLWFDPNFDVFIFNVLSAIGFGFIVLALFLDRPTEVALLTGLALILCYPILINLLPSVPAMLNNLLSSMLVPGAFPFARGKLFIIGYPPVPWLGIMLLGYACGRCFAWARERRVCWFLWLGVICLSLFTLVRSVNVLGDPVPWSVQASSSHTLLSYLNVSKYPPSLSFDLCMLGIMFLLLAWAEKVSNKLTMILSVFGKAPLFYFVIHWYIIHPILFVILVIQGYGFSEMYFETNFGRPVGPSGLGLTGVYLIWVLVVVALYPMCKWFIGFKQRHRENKWIGYL